MFDWWKKKKEKKADTKAGKGVKPWDEGKARNENYRRTTGPDTHAILEAKRANRQWGTPQHHLKKRKR